MNRKRVIIGLVSTLGLITLSSGSLFLQDDFSGKFGKYQGYHGLDIMDLDKKVNGTAVAYTQSAHDQTAPGTCASCHGGGSVTPQVTVTADPPFGGAGDTYVPGTTYTITYDATGYPFFGIDVEMNKGNTVTSMTSGSLAIKKNTRYTANPYSQGFPSNISHQNRIPDSLSAVFIWNAPITPDTVYFFSNTVGANGNGNDSGDKEVFKNFILYPTAAGLKKNTANSFAFEVYPNPVTDLVKVSFVTTTKEKVQLSLLDLNGKQVVSGDVQWTETGSNQLSLSTDGLARGMYTLKLQLAGEVKTKKIMVY